MSTEMGNQRVISVVSTAVLMNATSTGKAFLASRKEKINTERSSRKLFSGISLWMLLQACVRKFRLNASVSQVHC